MNKGDQINHYNGKLPFTSLLLLIFSFYSCNEKPIERKAERSFYYWKSVVKLTAFELKRLDSLQVKNIYLKFFDVDFDISSNQAIPIAKMQIQDRGLIGKYNIIPTVFITNASIQKIDSTQTKLLAAKIYGLINDLCKKYQINHIAEIQLDCDWTASTRDKYFSLLQQMKQVTKTTISATIRLHQIKYISSSGIPPADRGLLMCYNMGNLKNPATKNSIIETTELRKYIGNLSSYPLPLDIALPLFEWKVLFRENIYKGLIENIPDVAFTNSFTRKEEGRFEILKDTILAGYDLRKGDVLRSEESNIAELTTSAKEVNQRLKNTLGRVSLYHLDSVTLSKFTTNELEGIYTIFR